MSNIDASMRRRQGIFEFCEDEDCIFRLRGTTAGEAPALVDAGLPADARVLELHFWNEHLPELPVGGPDLAWANRARRAAVSSLKKLAAYIQNEPDLQDITMLFGVTVLFDAGGTSGAERYITRLGFSCAPHGASLGRVARFWENVHTWLIMRTFNKATLRARRPLSLPRTLAWMSRDELLGRYGG